MNEKRIKKNNSLSQIQSQSLAIVYYPLEHEQKKGNEESIVKKLRRFSRSFSLGQLHETFIPIFEYEVQHVSLKDLVKEFRMGIRHISCPVEVAFESLSKLIQQLR